MSDEEIIVGDWVKITVKVLKKLPEQVMVELFSKTDQYESCWIRLDACEKTEAPIPPEPDHEAIVRDKDGDFWSYAARYGGWMCGFEVTGAHAWESLWRGFGPLKVYELTS